MAMRMGLLGLGADYPAPMPSALPADPGDYGPGGRSEWLDVDWREHQRWVAVGGRRVNVIELGAGDADRLRPRAVGLLAELAGEHARRSRATHRVIALDLPGFGASQMPRGGDLDRRLRALRRRRCCEQLGVERATVVGNSMGGFIGAELAIEFPERVERLVLVCAAGLTTEGGVHDSVIGRAGSPRRRRPGLLRLDGVALATR